MVHEVGELFVDDLIEAPSKDLAKLDDALGELQQFAHKGWQHSVDQLISFDDDSRPLRVEVVHQHGSEGLRAGVYFGMPDINLEISSDSFFTSQTNNIITAYPVVCERIQELKAAGLSIGQASWLYLAATALICQKERYLAEVANLIDDNPPFPVAKREHYALNGLRLSDGTHLDYSRFTVNQHLGNVLKQSKQVYRMDSITVAPAYDTMAYIYSRYNNGTRELEAGDWRMTSLYNAETPHPEDLGILRLTVGKVRDFTNALLHAQILLRQ